MPLDEPRPVALAERAKRYRARHSARRRVDVGGPVRAGHRHIRIALETGGGPPAVSVSVCSAVLIDGEPREKAFTAFLHRRALDELLDQLGDARRMLDAADAEDEVG